MRPIINAMTISGAIIITPPTAPAIAGIRDDEASEIIINNNYFVFFKLLKSRHACCGNC